ncbi:MAG: DUF6292 family protein [Umezawaea sp.]
MDVDFDYEATRKLRRYALQVSEALGQRGESWCVESERPGSLYLAVDGRSPRFPDDDLALVWKERRGWFALAEESGGARLHEIAHLTGQVSPPPGEVAGWVAALLTEDPRQLPMTA